MNEQYRRGFLQGLLGLAVYAVVSPSRLFSAPTPVPSPDSAPETASQMLAEQVKAVFDTIQDDVIEERQA